MTSGTYGPRSSTSSGSAALASSLESKLRLKTASLGSTLYQLTLKARVTPSGLSIFALRASVRRISASAHTGSGWPTPSATDHKGGYHGGRERNGKLSVDRLDVAAQLGSWPTPTTPSGGQTFPSGTTPQGLTPDGRKTQVTLALVADAAGWPTPDTMNHRDPATLRQMTVDAAERGSSKGVSLHHAAGFAGWPTPVARDYFPAHTPDYIAEKVAQGHGMANLNDRAQLTADGPARLTASGQMLTGSSAGTKSGGPLNPAHSRWLMLSRVEWERWAPGYQDWQLWSALMLAASPEPKPSEPEPSAPLGTV